MAHHSALTILPRFLWKPIFDYLPAQSLKKLSNMHTFANLFTDAYCKELILSNKTGIIKVIRTSENRIDNFWIHAYNTYVEYNHLTNLMSSIDQKTKKLRYITIFIQPGKYYNYYYSDYNSFGTLYVSINGSKTGQTDFYGTHKYVPYDISLKNIVYIDDIRIDVQRQLSKTASIRLSNCIFNKYFVLRSAGYLSISNCIFNGSNIMSSIQHLIMSDCVLNCQNEYNAQHLVITKCILNPKTNIMISCNNNSTVDFNQNMITQTASIMSITGLDHSTIKIHNNIISEVDACISLHKYKSIRGKNFFLMQNNSITNMPHKYNRIDYAGVINAGKKLNSRIRSKCKFILDESNTLINCGFTADANIKN